MHWVVESKKISALVVSIFFSVIMFLFAESWLILAAKVFGPIWGTIICFSIATPISWLVIFMTEWSRSGSKIRDWLSNQELRLSKRKKMVAKYGKFIVVIITAITMGPILSALLLAMLGCEVWKNYIYSTLCSLLCYSIWCSFYSGLWRLITPS